MGEFRGDTFREKHASLASLAQRFSVSSLEEQEVFERWHAQAAEELSAYLRQNPPYLHASVKSRANYTWSVRIGLRDEMDGHARLVKSIITYVGAIVENGGNPPSVSEYAKHLGIIVAKMQESPHAIRVPGIQEPSDIRIGFYMPFNPFRRVLIGDWEPAGIFPTLSDAGLRTLVCGLSRLDQTDYMHMSHLRLQNYRHKHL